MKKIVLFLLIFFFTPSIIVKIHAESRKCDYSFNHHFSHDTLYVSTYFYYDSNGDCGTSNTMPTYVDLGNGDSLYWIGSKSTYYVYPCNGNFHIHISAPGTMVDTTVSITDIPECNLDFQYSLSRDATTGIYYINCLKTDACQSKLCFWSTGGMRSYGGDSATFTYPKENEGSTVEVCLQRNYTCSVNKTCKEITLSPDQATVVNPSIDQTVYVHFFPSLVRDQLQVESHNLDDDLTVKIFTVDGKEIRSIEYPALQTNAMLTINLQSLPIGIYFVKAIARQQNFPPEKIVKE